MRNTISALAFIIGFAFAALAIVLRHGGSQAMPINGVLILCSTVLAIVFSGIGMLVKL